MILQAPPPQGDLLLQYGAIGLMVLALAWVVTLLGRRMLKEIDDLRSQRDSMVETVLKVVPLMEQSTAIHLKRQAADELTRNELSAIRVNQERMQEDLRALRRRLEAP